MDPKHPLSLQNKKISHKEKPYKRQKTLSREKNMNKWPKTELSRASTMIHRSRQIWPINSPDPISISQSEMASKGYRRLPYEICDSDQREQREPLIKRVDRRPRLTHDIALAKYKEHLPKAQGLCDMRLRHITSQYRIGAIQRSGANTICDL